MSADVKGISMGSETSWAELLKQHLSHRWRQKLSITFVFVPIFFGAYYFVLNWFSQQNIFVEVVSSKVFNYAIVVYVVGMLSLVWFGPLRSPVSDSFLEIDLRRRSEPRKFRPVPLCANAQATAVLVADGQVKYYPTSRLPKNIVLEEYVSSQQAEVDRLSVSPSDMSILAKLIDDHGLLKLKKSVAPSESEIDEEVTVKSSAELVEKSVYVSAFVTSIENVIKSLDFQIETAERKASNLLDVGRKYLKNGIYCYAFSIVVWQVVLYVQNYQWNWGLGAGVISCAVAFIVVEFLAAWFLKQYRHYGDSVQTYMMVRSVYERHLLAYYAVDEFSEIDKDNEVCRSALLKALSEEIKWPDLKEVNANDFNYMIKSFESVSGVLEKIRIINGKPEQKAGA